MIVFVLAPRGTGQLLLVNSIAIPVNDRVAFLLSVFGLWPQSGSGLLPGKGVWRGGGCGGVQTNAMLAPSSKEGNLDS